jgi:SMC interacting uncharacterized protein involved in chromosome segregation
MDKEKLDELWKVLSSATNIGKLHYDEAVTIGGVFGQMRSEIERLKEEIEALREVIDVLQLKDSDFEQIIRPTGICTYCWENSTENSKYGDVCDECLPLTKKES